ncbi:Ig-like domain-containing protein [Bacillus sp. D386]|uniref:Ig-like domain-containing protein n=1 Tax=Bacillus sp. D386 TaxID=2587155 RepID=UPI00111D6137|nr:Ig-like domain-containing protein [Bacillus sp. D386]
MMTCTISIPTFQLTSAITNLVFPYSFQRQLSGWAEPGSTITIKHKNHVVAVTKANTKGYFKAHINYRKGTVLTITAIDASK